MRSPLLLDGPALAVALHRSPKTVRNWAAQGLLARHGKDSKGRTLYNIDEAIQLAATLDATRLPVLSKSGVASTGHPDAAA